MSRIIGLTGPAGVGKSTIAGALGLYGFERVRMAAPLKRMMYALYEAMGLEHDDIQARIEGASKEAPDDFLCGATPRWAMQSLGTEWGRSCVNSDLWVAAWRRMASSELAVGAGGVVAEDVRFANEVLVIRSMGGVIVGLRRKGVDGQSNHPSEAGVEPDCWMENDAPPSCVAERILQACPVIAAVRKGPEDKG